MLEKFDVHKMHAVYDRWPEIARESFDSNLDPEDFSDVDHIVFAGMGGSGAVGDMFASILSKTKIHVNVVKGYLLPKTVNNNTLVVVVSVSGNTKETMSILNSAHKIGSKIIVFSSGGKMQKYCEKNKIKYRNIQQNHSPRASFTSFLYSILKVLYSTLQIKQSDIFESIEEMKNLNKKICSSNLTDANPALNIAKWIKGIPIIYYPFGLQSAAIRFKNSLQENAKLHVMTEDVIEVCHNGIVSWEKKSNIQPILIVGENDHVKTKERWNILKEYFDLNKINYCEIPSVKGSILTKLINLIYFLDYVSIYCAILNKTEPSSVKSIDFIKERLQKNETD